MSRIVEVRTNPAKYGGMDVILDTGERLECIKSIEWLNHLGEAQILRLEIVLKEQPKIKVNP